jgi:hypothetical protein
MHALQTQTVPSTHGQLAWQVLGRNLELQVLSSPNGFYIGTIDEDGPCSRESKEYWPTAAAAKLALDNGTWAQLPNA